MTQQEIDREIKSGWRRTALTTAVAIASLAGSTYIVVSKITQFEQSLQQALDRTKQNDTRIARLEAQRVPDSENRSEVTTTLRLVISSLDEIKRRLERIEERSMDRGRQP